MASSCSLIIMSIRSYRIRHGYNNYCFKKEHHYQQNPFMMMSCISNIRMNRILHNQTSSCSISSLSLSSLSLLLPSSSLSSSSHFYSGYTVRSCSRKYTSTISLLSSSSSMTDRSNSITTAQKPTQQLDQSQIHRINHDDNIDLDGQKITTASTSNNDNTNTTLSIYDMDYYRIRKLNNIDDIEILCNQICDLKNPQPLTIDDIGSLIVPLTRVAASNPDFGIKGATIIEKLLFHCLRHLPYDYLNNVINNKNNNVINNNNQLPQPKVDDQYVTDSNNNITKLISLLNHRNILPYPTTSLYNRCMMAWGTLRHKEAAERCDRIFHLMLSEYKREEEFIIYCRNILLKQNNQNNHDNTIDNALLFQCRSAKPDRKTYKSLIRAWAISNDPKGPAKAYYYLKELEKLSGVDDILKEHRQQNEEQIMKQQNIQNHNIHNNYNSNHNANNTNKNENNNNIKFDLIKHQEKYHIEFPDRPIYNSVLASYSKIHVLKHPHALRRINEIINRMDTLYSITNIMDCFYLDSLSYHSWLRGYSRYISYNYINLSSNYSNEIEYILKRIHSQQKLYDEQKLLLYNNNHNHNNTINNINSIETDENIANDNNYYNNQSYNNQYNNNQNKNILIPQLIPNLSMVWAYGVLVEALVKTNPVSHFLREATSIIYAIIGTRRNVICRDFDFTTMSIRSTTNIHPKLQQQSQVYSNSYTGKIQPSSNNTEPIWPRTDTILRVVRGWEYSGLPNADEEIEKLLRTAVVEAPIYKRIYYLNRSMEEWELSGWKYTPELLEMMLLNALQRTSSKRDKPTGQTFAIVIRSWLKSKRHESAHRIELLVEQMISLYENQHDIWYRPNEVHIRYLLSSWVDKCTTGLKYDGISGNNIYPAQHCEALLDRYRGSDWFDDNISGMYAMALRAWALQVIMPDNKNHNEEEVVVVVECDDDGLHNNDIPNPIKQASLLINHLEEHLQSLLLSSGNEIRNEDYHSNLIGSTGSKNILPAYPCNWVLEICSKPQSNRQQRLEAYQLAVDTFRKCNCNPRSYVLMSTVIQSQVFNHSSSIEENRNNVDAANKDSVRITDDVIKTNKEEEEHIKAIEDLFNECCQNGMLTQDMVCQVIRIAPPQSIQKLFGVTYQYDELVKKTWEQKISTNHHHDDSIIESKISPATSSDDGHLNKNHMNMNNIMINEDIIPNTLRIKNLPKEWSANANTQRNTKKPLEISEDEKYLESLNSS